MRRKLTLFLFLVFAYVGIASAQSVITGKVSDKSGQPLPGVTVRVQGTTTAAATDVNGSYKINAPEQGTLVFSFIGFENQTVAIAGQTVMNITLTENTNKLNEVVVVGYGTQSRKTVTGAISRVTGGDLADQQVVRVDQALQGRTSGVAVVASSGAPGAGPTIRIRGTTSINSSEPLYVVDGAVVLNGGIDNINPADIESIDVLKDASAAIYGSRASAGVILVTTKKGKSGTPQISYSGYAGVQNPVSRIKMVNASQYATLRNEAATNDGKATLPFANPASYGTGTNWQDVIFGNGALIQNHNLSMQGATEKSNYYVSFGYLDQHGTIFPEVSNYKRYNFTANTSTKIKKWLTIGENFSYAYNRSQQNFNTNSEFGGPLSSALNLDPITPVIISDPSGQPNASLYTAAGQYPLKNAQGQYYGISPYVQNEITNPQAYLQTILGNYNWSHNLFGNAFIELAPIAGLKIRSQISGKQSFYGSQSFNSYYYLNANNFNNSNPSEFRSTNRNLTWNWDNTASYTRSFGRHNLTALIGTSAQQASEVDMGVTYNNLPITDRSLLSFNYTVPNTSILGYSGEAQPYHVFSYFGRINYDFDQKYLFTGIIRRDGSSKFGTNNVYGTFPSAELGWVVTKENFFPKNTFVDFLKIRGSYGVLGNEQSLGTFQYVSVVGSGYNTVLGNNQLTIGNAPNSPPNPDLKWESVHSSDIGFDAVLFKNINVTFDLYRKVTKGMLQVVPLPGYAGFNNGYSANVGNLENKGAELEIGYNKTVRDFRFNLSGNIAYNHNMVNYLGLTPYYQSGNVQSVNNGYQIFRTQVGQPVNSFYGFKELGVFHSQAEVDAYTHGGAKIQPNAKPGDFKWQDTNGDGQITEADRTFLGSQLPTWTYGFTFNATYKNFDLKVFGQGVWGNQIYQAYRRLDIAGANYQVAALNAWTPSNPSSNYPRLTDSDPNNNFNNPSNFYLQSGAYFRIRTLQIGYNVPKSVLSKLDIQRLRVYVSSNNLATITGYTGFDPEISGGIDRGIYPQSRSFLLGLDITL